MTSLKPADLEILLEAMILKIRRKNMWLLAVIVFMRRSVLTWTLHKWLSKCLGKPFVMMKLVYLSTVALLFY